MFISLEYALAHSNGATWVSFTCPNHDDKTPSARANTLTGRYVCMVCGHKGKGNNYEPPEKAVIEQVRRLSEETSRIPESLLDLYDCDGPGEYWSGRFTQEACRHFRLGYDTNKEKSLYPLRDPRGDLIGLVYRNYPGEKPKYRYPRGVGTSKLLFNYHEIEARTPVVVVEGAPDVIALWEAGIPAVGTFGARLLPAQQSLLSRLEPSVVVLAYDQDQAGRLGALEAVSALLGAGVQARRARWDDYKDVGEMPVGERQKKLGKFLGTG